MALNRRDFTLASLAAIAASSGLTLAVKAQGTKTIAVLFDGLYSEFWVAGIQIIRDELKKRGYEIMEAISDQDDNKQFEQVRAAIARKVDGIIIVQTDSNAVIPAIKAANAANIPMVHFNRPPAQSDAFSVAIQADNQKIAREAVDYACTVAQKSGKKHQAAILIGDLGDPNAIQRRDGFQEAVDKYPDAIEVVAKIPTEWNADTAFAGLTNALQANPDISFLFTSSDFLLPQIQQALKTADKWHKVGEDGHVILTGFDGFPDAYALMKDGYMDACGVQNLFFETQLAIQAILDLGEGKKVEKLLLDPGFAITQANMNEKASEMWGYVLWKEKNPG
ncbi:sugar ABC transporter substrate-binding protein [Mesorhizobium sp. RP14(2022)]|uniref:Sugar ABC transporter substrate-binding protein n=1 Tax=Mesorhizobium liriopis TaxID=2953882 RepID=A0ABT1C4D8_9HYPH|nr:sugar ABC transporter substrate-binding protein [Mesorhizobium liriopis]MCO6049679.1 sugar ABC transporter substrate-binding protein [Mesorhizobium liriopis]